MVICGWRWRHRRGLAEMVPNSESAPIGLSITWDELREARASKNLHDCGGV